VIPPLLLRSGQDIVLNREPLEQFRPLGMICDFPPLAVS
jgi:hypothetical protein